MVTQWKQSQPRVAEMAAKGEASSSPSPPPAGATSAAGAAAAVPSRSACSRACSLRSCRQAGRWQGGAVEQGGAGLQLTCYPQQQTTMHWQGPLHTLRGAAQRTSRSRT